MVAMDPISAGPLRQVGGFSKRVGGAELNVAVALARLGHRAAWAGSLGDDEFGAEVLAFLRVEGVDAAGAVLSPDAPTGVYFKERRALGRLRVYYYRAGSAASLMAPEDLDVESLLSASVLHLTGITPALSEGCYDLTKQLMEAARERGVMVSFDANVRHRLFGGREPREVLWPLLERADLLFLSEEEAELLLGGRAPSEVEKAKERLAAETVVVHGRHRAFAVDANGLTDSVPFSADEVDSVGAGDAFVAGYLSGRLRGLGPGSRLELANACGTCAVTLPGDAESMPRSEDVGALIGGREFFER